MLETDLRRVIDKAWDRVWSSGISNPLDCVEYLGVLLFILRDSGREVNAFREAVSDRDGKKVEVKIHEVSQRFGIGPGANGTSPWRDLQTVNDVFELLASVAIRDRNEDIVGDIFEYVLGKLSTAGHMGQFRTPRHVIQFLVDVVDPGPDDVVLDPACGTAGFLIAAKQHDPRINQFVGEEVDQTIYRLARANAEFHHLGQDAIHCRDSLANLGAAADIILANPPFAGKVVGDRLAPFQCKTRRTELLFLELMERRLRPGGRAGVVVPFGVLTGRNSASLWIRRQLLFENQLRAVVEMPRGVFRPYTDVKTALLIWESGGRTEEVWMARVHDDGFSLDDRRTPIDDSDLPVVQKLIHGEGDPGESTNLAQKFSLKQIEDAACDLNPSRYLPPLLSGREGDGESDPHDIWSELQSDLTELNSVVSQMSELL